MKQLRTAGVLVAAVVLLAACTAGSTAADPTTSTTSPSSTVTSTSTVSATSTTTSPEDSAAAHAEEVLRAYYRAQTACLADAAKVEMTCFDQVAVGTALTDMRNALSSARARETHVNGAIEVVTVDRNSVDLANDPTKTPPVVPQVTFRVCIDVSGFNIVDKDGKSIVPADRSARSVGSVVVANYRYPDPGDWRVAYIVPDKGATC
ncbi:MAG: hypothetical protein WCG47_32060 [Dermatophilaceae bacterium]